MIRKTTLYFVLSICVFCNLYAQQNFHSVIPFFPDERWWGGFVAMGSQMPYGNQLSELDLSRQNFNNQGVPLLVSNKGRFIWSDDAFKFSIQDNKLHIQSAFEEVKPIQAGKSLRDAYLAACKIHFPPSGKLPDSLFFSMPQYNTWIELMYDQNQDDIIKYAENIVKNNFPKGILMVDDNWQKYYGNFEFKPDKFPEPKKMINKLHSMGFKVMLWVCPFVSADSPEFRELEAKGYLLKQKGSSSAAMIRWWNGYSACYDFTNPNTSKYFVALLKDTQERYGIDGFKFDAGDVNFYNEERIDSYKKDARSTDHTMAWAKIGLQFPFNEYRACWRMGGEPLVQRLGDKHNSWKHLQLLIPDMIAAGLLGYSYACPDMIGGGQITSFENLDSSKFNQDLIVRSAQTHTLMPMMQFSVAPWRILNAKNLEICRRMADLHVKMGNYILNCAKHSSQTGEPIIRHMEYSFPNEGFSGYKDQFMLGDKFLIAPILTQDNVRKVKLPKGKWKDDLGKVYSGGIEIIVNAGIERLPYFEKIK